MSLVNYTYIIDRIWLICIRYHSRSDLLRIIMVTTIQYNAITYDTIQYNATQCNIIQHRTPLSIQITGTSGLIDT